MVGCQRHRGPWAGAGVSGMAEPAAAHPEPVVDPSSVPVPALFDDVVGQPRAVAQLTAAARRPGHAYLLPGPPG